MPSAGWTFDRDAATSPGPARLWQPQSADQPRGTEGYLARDVGRLGAGAPFFGQHVPGVGLDLQVRRTLVVAKRRQHGLKVGLGGTDFAKIGQENRDVAMNAPFAVGAPFLERRDRIRQIDVARKAARP